MRNSDSKVLGCFNQFSALWLISSVFVLAWIIAYKSTSLSDALRGMAWVVTVMVIALINTCISIFFYKQKSKDIFADNAPNTPASIEAINKLYNLRGKATGLAVWPILFGIAFSFFVPWIDTGFGHILEWSFNFFTDNKVAQLLTAVSAFISILAVLVSSARWLFKWIWR